MCLISSLLTSDKKLFSGTLLIEGWSLSVDREEFGGVDRTALIDGLTDHINDSAEGFGTDGHFNGIMSVSDGLSTNQTLSRVQSDGAHVIASQMLGDLKDEAVISALNLERIENGRKFTFELHIDDGADNLGNFTGGGTEATFTSQIRSVKIGALKRARRGRFVTYAWLLAWSASVTRSYEIIIIIFRHSTSSKTQQNCRSQNSICLKSM